MCFFTYSIYPDCSNAPGIMSECEWMLHFEHVAYIGHFDPMTRAHVVHVHDRSHSAHKHALRINHSHPVCLPVNLPNTTLNSYIRQHISTVYFTLEKGYTKINWSVLYNITKKNQDIKYLCRMRNLIGYCTLILIIMSTCLEVLIAKVITYWWGTTFNCFSCMTVYITPPVYIELLRGGTCI